MRALHCALPELVRDPLVTIAIPTFNRAHWLRECVRGALAQSYERLEVVVSDNASTDDTQKTLKEFDDRRLRVIRQRENIGATANWNACLSEAKGDYIVFVPDDDRIFPSLVERCVTLVRSEPELPIVMAIGNGYIVEEDRSLPPVFSRRLRTGIWDGIEVLQEYLKGKISVEGCTTMLRTEALRTIGGFPHDWPFAGDLARHLTLLFAGKAGLVNECCGTYCLHSATLTSRHTLEAHLADLQKLVDLLIDNAKHKIANQDTRRKVELQAMRFLAHHAFGVIASHRRRGAKHTAILPVVWQWRGRLSHIGINAFGLARPIALLILPLPIAHWFRRLKRAFGG